MSAGDSLHTKDQTTEGVYDLLDGASGEIQAVKKQVADQHGIAADPDESLDDRLEAYDDIIDSEVGDTTLIRARNVEREMGLRQIYLKFEGGNPTGTQKDRIAFAQVRDALRRGFDTVTVATCGNYGVAMALAASLAGLRCLVYIPGSYRTRRIQEIREQGAEIVRLEGDYEAAVEVSSSFAAEAEIYDANPGGANVAVQIRAYGQISYEIYDELRDAPYAVAVPVSNGTTLAGIYKGFLSLYRRGKTSRMPRMVAGSSFGKNPIIRAFQKNTETCLDLDPALVRESPVNEPLVNWHSIDGDLALDAVRETRGWAAYATDREMRAHSRLIRDKEGMIILPASTAGLIALKDLKQKEELQNDRFVAVVTGRGR